MTDGSDTRLGHVPMLDGARGLAIALVVLHHASLLTSGAGGSVGVALFFVLSGFLITTILIERQVVTRTAFASFYYRRAIRLLPAFLTMAVASAAALAILGGPLEGLRISSIAATYLANWPMAFGEWLGPMSHSWSLAIEEQFYLLWPVLLMVGWPILRRLGAWPLIGSAVLISLARVLLWNTYQITDRLAFGTDTQADGLLLGAGIAVLRMRHHLTLPGLVAPISLAALIAVAWLIPLGDGYFAIGPIAVTASGALILATLNNPDRLSHRVPREQPHARGGSHQLRRLPLALPNHVVPGGSRRQCDLAPCMGLDRRIICRRRPELRRDRASCFERTRPEGRWGGHADRSQD